MTMFPSNPFQSTACQCLWQITLSLDITICWYSLFVCGYSLPITSFLLSYSLYNIVHQMSAYSLRPDSQSMTLVVVSALVQSHPQFIHNGLFLCSLHCPLLCDICHLLLCHHLILPSSVSWSPPSFSHFHCLLHQLRCCNFHCQNIGMSICSQHCHRLMKHLPIGQLCGNTVHGRIYASVQRFIR